MSNDNDNDFDLLAEADAFLKGDVQELDDLIMQAKDDKEVKNYLSIAIKAKELADLYYSALEDFSPKFVYYKEIAAEYYQKVAKDLNFALAELMAVLMYLQTNNLKKAQKLFKSVLKKQKGTRKKKHLVDDTVIDLVQDLIDGKISETVNLVKKGLLSVDENIRSDVSHTIKYMRIRAEI